PAPPEEGGGHHRLPKKSARAPGDPPETLRERGGRLMAAVENVAPAIGTAPACRALGLPRSSLYRMRQPAEAAAPRPAPPRTLTPIECQVILDVLHSERFVDQAPAEVHATLLDEGQYLCSTRTMYRILDSAQEIKERRNQVRRPQYSKPELLATRPNEVWSWD